MTVNLLRRLIMRTPNWIINIQNAIDKERAYIGQYEDYKKLINDIKQYGVEQVYKDVPAEIPYAINFYELNKNTDFDKLISRCEHRINDLNLRLKKAQIEFKKWLIKQEFDF